MNTPDDEKVWAHYDDIALRNLLMTAAAVAEADEALAKVLERAVAESDPVRWEPTPDVQWAPAWQAAAARASLGAEPPADHELDGSKDADRVGRFLRAAVIVLGGLAGAVAAAWLNGWL